MQVKCKDIGPFWESRHAHREDILDGADCTDCTHITDCPDCADCTDCVNCADCTHENTLF